MKTKFEPVSIIMSVYNENKIILTEAIESILNQTYKDFEFIIILDNPNNAVAKKIINSYCDKDNRIVFVENKKNMGLSLSLNKGLQITNYDIIARMDADDISHPNRIEKQVNFLKSNQDVDLISSRIEYIDEDSQSLDKKHINVTSTDLVYKLLPYINPFSHPTWMFRKQMLKDLSGYRNLPTGQDYDFLLRAKNLGYNLRIMDDVLLKYRVRKNSISTSNQILQQKITIYIQKLYFERKRKGFDSYNQKYIDTIKYDREYQKYKKSYEYYLEYKKLIEKQRYLTAYLQFLLSLCFSKDQRKSIYNAIMTKLILNNNKNIIY